MPLLQIALDDLTRDECFALIERVEPHVDIVEVGTPLLMRYGVPLIADVKSHFDVQVLSDAKIMDAAYYETMLSLDAGADYVTIMALTDDGSIADGVRAVRERGATLVADLLCVTDLPGRARQLDALGVDVLAVHTGVDQQARGRTPLDDLKALADAGVDARLAVAGGISVATASDYLALGPDIVIVGGGITRAADPAAAASDLAALIRKEPA